MIAFTCPRCGRQFHVVDEFVTRSILCPTCKRPLTVPRTEAALAVSSPAEINGLTSCLAAPQVQATVTLPAAPVPSQAEEKSVGELLAGASDSSGRYVLERELGRGGMGVVIRGIDRDIRREVAVKFMLDGQDSRKKARFIEEAQIAGQLEHPNIVPVHEFGIDSRGCLFFSMKMVHGRSLSDILAELRRKPEAAREWSLARLLNVLVNVCHAVAYAHSRSVIHRDLKPANIMVGGFGEVYVMDWGLAKVLAGGPGSPAASAAPPSEATVPVITRREVGEEGTQDGSIVGTVAYMPPEQALGRIPAIDRRSDIYALGAILYALLTLQPPIEVEGDHFAASLLRVTEGDIKPPELRAPKRTGQIPRELSAVAMKALARERDDRYQSVEDFRRDLERFLEGRSVSAKADSKWEMAVKFAKRNRGFSAASLVGGVLLLAMLIGSSAINYQARVRADSARVQSEQHYDAYVQEQHDKREQARRSAPAFLRAGRLMAGERRCEDALTQVNAALDFDPGQTDGYLLKGQVLLALERYAEAVEPLREYLRREPEDPLAGRLLKLAEQPQPEKAGFLLILADVFQEQKAFALAGHMTRLAERFIGPLRERLPLYRKRIDTAWPGIGSRLELSREGKFFLDLNGLEQIRDLSPLKDMPLSVLNIGNLQLHDLGPLRGMPLVDFTLVNCRLVRDLGPLRGMPLHSLEMMGATAVSDLGPLRGLPLTRLGMRGCKQVTDLEPLRGMPLAYLSVMDCFGIRDLEPLRGMKLRELDLSHCRQIQDLSPLRGQPLESLFVSGLRRSFKTLAGADVHLHFLEVFASKSPAKGVLKLRLSQVRDFELLRGMPLSRLSLSECWHFGNYELLAAMPLTELWLDLPRNLRDLTFLRGKQLTRLQLAGAKKVQDFEPLRGMPITSLNLMECQQLKNLEFVRGMKLQWLNLRGCEQLHDLTPLQGAVLKEVSLSPRFIHKGMETLRSMKTLETIIVDQDRGFRPEEFWRLYDKGEFGK